MTTPNDTTWPGVSELKDYKPSFPTWSENILKKSVKNINSVGLDLLQVINQIHQIIKKLTYLFIVFYFKENVDL